MVIVAETQWLLLPLILIKNAPHLIGHIHLLLFELAATSMANLIHVASHKFKVCAPARHERTQTMPTFPYCLEALQCKQSMCSAWITVLCWRVCMIAVVDMVNVCILLETKQAQTRNMCKCVPPQKCSVMLAVS